MNQLSGQEEKVLFDILISIFDRNQLKRLLSNNELPRLEEVASDSNLRVQMASVINEISIRFKIIELVEGGLAELGGSSPPLQQWLDKNRQILEERRRAFSASANKTLKNNEFAALDEGCSRFRIMHLSDFHFSFGEAPTTRRHSLPHLRGIEKVFEKAKPDLVIVTGDLSEHGDKNSLERAKNWLNGKETFDGESYGLNLSEMIPMIPFVVVPGDADFTEKPVGGDAESRINTSLRYFRQLFSDREVGPGVSYLSADQEFVFFFKFTIPPSSEECSRESPTEGYSTAEVRDVYRHEWKRISTFHSKACENGVYENGSQLITPQQYTQSLKLLITHQPLLEGTPSMVESEVKLFLQSLASIGIHAIFCGHQHVHSFAQQSLSRLKRKKDPSRSVHRYLLHSLGINAPLHWFDGDGKRLPLRLRPFIVSLLEQAKSWIVNDSKTVPSDEALIFKCEDLLRDMLNSQDDQIPIRMISQLKSQLLEAHRDEESVNEVACIEELLKNLTYQQISKLREACKSKPVMEFYREFYKRNVIQCRCGSSAKIKGPSNRQRNLQVYDIAIFPEHWSIHCTVYSWGNSNFNPEEPPWVANVKR